MYDTGFRQQHLKTGLTHLTPPDTAAVSGVHRNNEERTPRDMKT
jgi:hypothetical protein